jgi:hypothetical protein
VRRLIIFLVVAAAAGAQAPPARNATGTAKLEVPENLGPHLAPEQPLPYSHKTHVSRGLDCRTCHINPEPGNQMTFPTVAICMGCHKTIAKDRPAIIKLSEYAESGRPVPWVRVYQVTPGVTWTHRKHLQAGLQCMNCHGDVGQLERMSQTSAVTSMASCISCHQSHNASTICQTCHAWPARE